MFQTNSKSLQRFADQHYIEDSEYQVQPTAVVSALPPQDPHIFQNFISQYNYYLSSPTHSSDNTQQYKRYSFPINSSFSHALSPNQLIQAKQDPRAFSNQNQPFSSQEGQQNFIERSQVTQNQRGPSSFNDFFSHAANVSQFHKNFQQSVRECISHTDRRELQQTSQEKQDLTKGGSEKRNYYQDLDSLCNEIKMQSNNPELGERERSESTRQRANSILEQSNCRERFRLQASEGQNKQNKISQKEQPLFKQMVRQQYQRITEQSSRQDSQKSFSKLSDRKSEQYKPKQEVQRRTLKSQTAKDCNQKKSSNLDAKADEILMRAREKQALQAEIQKQKNITKAKQNQMSQKLPKARNPDQKQDFKYKLKQIQKQQLQDQLNQFYNNQKEQTKKEEQKPQYQKKEVVKDVQTHQNDTQHQNLKKEEERGSIKEEERQFTKSEILPNSQNNSPSFFPSLQLSDFRQNSRQRLHAKLFQPVKQAKLNQQSHQRLDNRPQTMKESQNQVREFVKTSFDRASSPKATTITEIIHNNLDKKNPNSENKTSLRLEQEVQNSQGKRENQRYRVLEVDHSPKQYQNSQEVTQQNFIKHNLPYSSINKKQCSFDQFHFDHHIDNQNLYQKSQSTVNINNFDHYPLQAHHYSQRDLPNYQNQSYLKRSEEFLKQRRISRSPGPLNYQIKEHLVKPSSIQHRIPLGKRSDIALKSTSEAVGPGSYNLPTSTFNFQKQNTQRGRSPHNELSKLKLESLLRSHSLNNKQFNTERRQASKQVVESRPDFSIKQLKEDLEQRRIRYQREQDLKRELSENYREILTGQKLIQQKEPEEEEYLHTFTLSPLKQYQTLRSTRNQQLGKVSDQQRSTLLNKYNTPSKKNISSLVGEAKEVHLQSHREGSIRKPLSLDQNIHINPRQIQKLSQRNHNSSTIKIPTSREYNQFQDALGKVRSSSLRQIPQDFGLGNNEAENKFKRQKLVKEYQKPQRKILESKEASPFIRDFSQSHYSEDIYEIDPRDSLPTIKYFNTTEQEISNVNNDQQLLESKETLNQGEEEDQAVVSINLGSDSNSDQDVVEMKKQIHKQMKQLCKEQEQLSKRYPKTSTRQTQYFKNLSTDLEAINENPEGEEMNLQGAGDIVRSVSTDQDIERVMETSELSKDQDLKQLYKNYLKAKTQFKLYERTLKNFLKEESQLEISQSPKRIKNEAKNTSRSSSRQSQKHSTTHKQIQQQRQQQQQPKWKNKEEKKQSDQDIIALYKQNNMLIVESQTAHPKKSWSTLNLSKLKQNQKQKIIQKVENLIHHKETISDRLYDRNYKGRRRDQKNDKSLQNTSKNEEIEQVVVEEPLAELQKIKMEISIENLLPEQDSQLKDGHTIIINNGVSSLVEQESSFSANLQRKCKFYSSGKNGENHDQDCQVCAKKWQSIEQSSSNQDQTHLHNLSDQITPINKTSWSRGYGNSFKQCFTQQSEIMEIQGHLDELRRGNEMGMANQQLNREQIYQNIIKEMDEIDCSDVTKVSNQLIQKEEEKEKKKMEIQSKTRKREKELESNFGRLFDVMKGREEVQTKEEQQEIRNNKEGLEVKQEEEDQVQIPVMKLEIYQENIEVKQKPKEVKVSEFELA